MSGSELEYRVRFSDTDWMGLLHHAHYPRLFEWAREEFFRSVGHAWLDHIHEDRWLAVLELEYHVVGRARYDDVLHIHTTLTQVSRARIWLEYEVRAADAGEVVAPAGPCTRSSTARERSYGSREGSPSTSRRIPARPKSAGNERRDIALEVNQSIRSVVE